MRDVNKDIEDIKRFNIHPPVCKKHHIANICKNRIIGIENKVFGEIKFAFAVKQPIEKGQIRNE